jgi:DNA-binding MarR family transcriptional regulator
MLDQLAFYMGRVYYNYIGLLERELAHVGIDGTVAPGMGHTLFALYEKDDQIIKEIAARVQLSPSTLTGMLGRMQHAGLIVRHRDRADGRSVRVKLTPLARSLRPQCNLLVERVDAVLEAEMDEEDVAILKSLLARVIDNIQRAGRTTGAAKRGDYEVAIRSPQLHD